MFIYQPERITVGSVYHYLKTNIDGTIPEHIAYFLANRCSRPAIR